MRSGFGAIAVDEVEVIGVEWMKNDGGLFF
jgi:hypothetical protein